jgi:hypothetical protein
MAITDITGTNRNAEIARIPSGLASWRDDPFRSAIDCRARFILGVRDGLEMFERYQPLSRLSDRELATLGITRQQIPEAVLGLKAPASR